MRTRFPLRCSRMNQKELAASDRPAHSTVLAYYSVQPQNKVEHIKWSCDRLRGPW